jgi:CheY-like chemotaxis protein
VSQQTQLVLNTIGEGICIVDGDARCNWMNKKMQAWPGHVHERIRRTCQEAFVLFKQQVSPPNPDTPFVLNRSKRYALNVDDSQFLEMIASPVISPAGAVVQVVAVVWDATSTRRLQQKIDAIDKAGRELVRLEAEVVGKLHVVDRLKLLEEKIIRFTRDLMHFDHFNIRLLDRKTKKLEWVIGVGLPSEAREVELFAETEGNGISGYVAATGRSYICPDVERDPRYVGGLEGAKSSLTVPLRLHDKVIGIFNIEAKARAAFNEDDRQFAEIFARYVAIALNILDLLIVERVQVSHKVADDVCTDIAGPLNDIALDASELSDNFIGNEELRKKLQQILGNVATIRSCLKQAAEGPSHRVLGAGEVKPSEADPLIARAKILVADDDANFRTIIHDILRKYHATVTVVSNGAEAIDKLEVERFDLILSDIKMPDKTGYDVFAAARRRGTGTPVILMTGFGYDPHHSIVRASQEGLQAVLFKPFKVEQLLGEVRKALTQGGAAAGAAAEAAAVSVAAQ